MSVAEVSSEPYSITHIVVLQCVTGSSIFAVRRACLNNIFVAVIIDYGRGFSG